VQIQALVQQLDVHRIVEHFEPSQAFAVSIEGTVQAKVAQVPSKVACMRATPVPFFRASKWAIASEQCSHRLAGRE